MRRVDRGRWPLDEENREKTFQPDRKAKADLLARLGNYCSHVEVQNRGIVKLNREGQCARLVRHDEHRPGGEVTPRQQTKEVDERNPSAHQLTEPGVVSMIRVGAAVCMEEASFVTGPVVIGSIDRSTDRERVSPTREPVRYAIPEAGSARELACPRSLTERRSFESAGRAM